MNDLPTSLLSKIFCTALALIIFPAMALAGSDARQEVAGILKDLNHFPSAEQKETLDRISNNDSNSEAMQTIAAAVRDMEHKAKPADAAKLEKLAADPSVAEQDRELARIVMNINHKASPEAVAKLESMTK